MDKPRKGEVMAFPFRVVCGMCGAVMAIRIPVDIDTKQQVYVHPENSLCPFTGGHYAINQNFSMEEVEVQDDMPRIVDAGGNLTASLTKSNGGPAQ